MFFTPPPVLPPQESGSIQLSFWGEVAFYRGCIIVIGPKDPWMDRFKQADLSPNLQNIRIVYGVPKGETAGKLGIGNPGAYCYDRSGNPLAFLGAYPPENLKEWLVSLGWRSKEDAITTFLRNNPDRVDVKWSRFQLATDTLYGKPDKAAVQNASEALAALLKDNNWPSFPAIFRQPPLKPADADEDNPLSQLAREHWPNVTYLIQTTPNSPAAWTLAALLAEWHPGKPRLYQLIISLDPPPGERDLLSWPFAPALQSAETQLREGKDWKGMKELAQDRITRVRSQMNSYAKEAANQWSGTTIIQDGKVFNPTNKERLVGDLAHWLLLMLEAALSLNNENQAYQTAVQIDQETDATTRRAGYRLAEKHDSRTIMKLLNPY